MRPFKIVKHYIDIKKMMLKRREGRERIFQHKVSYATLLLVLLQVTNYCILISMLPEQEGGGESNGREERRRETEGQQDKGLRNNTEKDGGT